jgi:hypothetical protein
MYQWIESQGEMKSRGEVAAAATRPSEARRCSFEFAAASG